MPSVDDTCVVYRGDVMLNDTLDQNADSPFVIQQFITLLKKFLLMDRYMKKLYQLELYIIFLHIRCIIQ